jgi:hypothetical protein
MGKPGKIGDSRSLPKEKSFAKPWLDARPAAIETKLNTT